MHMGDHAGPGWHISLLTKVTAASNLRLRAFLPNRLYQQLAQHPAIRLAPPPSQVRYHH